MVGRQYWKLARERLFARRFVWGSRPRSGLLERRPPLPGDGCRPKHRHWAARKVWLSTTSQLGPGVGRSRAAQLHQHGRGRSFRLRQRHADHVYDGHSHTRGVLNGRSECYCSRTLDRRSSRSRAGEARFRLSTRCRGTRKSRLHRRRPRQDHREPESDARRPRSYCDGHATTMLLERCSDAPISKEGGNVPAQTRVGRRAVTRRSFRFAPGSPRPWRGGRRLSR